MFFRGSIGDMMLVASAKRGVLGDLSEMLDSWEDNLERTPAAALSLLELVAILEDSRTLM